MARSQRNRDAGRTLARIRTDVAVDMNQTEFGRTLARAMGIDLSFAQSTISSWEKGQRQVPAAVLLSALHFAADRGVQVDTLIGYALKPEPDESETTSEELKAAIRREILDALSDPEAKAAILKALQTS